MLTEKKFNLIIVLGIFAFSLIGYLMNEPYFITLATKIVILGIAGCALNLILGFGGMVSFGHAMFFGVGSYVAAISAFHSMNGESINLIFFDFNGSNQMLFNWFLAVIFSMFFCPRCWKHFYKNKRCIFHNDYFSLCTNDLLFFSRVDKIWW